MSKEVDNVNHPKHYEGSTSLECIECMEVCFGTQAVADFCLCNAFKYLWRYKNKNGKEDVDKAKWYIDWVQHKVDLGYSFTPSFLGQLERVRDMYITVGDKISNGGI